MAVSIRSVSLFFGLCTVFFVSGQEYSPPYLTSTETVPENITLIDEDVNFTGIRQGRGYSGDSYLDEAFDTCKITKNSLSCFKFKALRYLHKMASPLPDDSPTWKTEGFKLMGSTVRLLHMPDNMTVSREYVSSQLPDTIPRSSDSELDRFYKFALREAERFVRGHALVLSVPKGMTTGRDLEEVQSPRIIDEDELYNEVDEDEDQESRGKKKKLAILFPLLLFFKLKALLVPILLGVLFIKKLLVLGAILFPSLISLVKMCKPHHGGGHSYSGWASAPDSSAEYSTGYGHSPPFHGDFHNRRTGPALAYRGYHRHHISDDRNGV